MAYGTPESLDDVEAYYTHIRHGVNHLKRHSKI
ncbi:hypothetical protein BWGOE3_12000 [Bacillus mycoides]|uniref:Ferrochelatase 2 n=2 Tax=Bacillus cereus group TaxID=86661 RepID=J8F0F2_BACCE|nr:ferrochelatase 2 [Bacillus cereus MC67]EJV58995.1 ferrochelatase 2 [Bacillus cereus BAG6O-2]EOP13558.1 hypothetical protein II1_03150 [Bacillus cereus MC118]OFD45900.1 hypothetical protein BWGOE2_11260 [Bacillus mycoides]OFD49005.1 hypothetical protein BWGOE1_11750 [Bacillus mycoides]